MEAHDQTDESTLEERVIRLEQRVNNLQQQLEGIHQSVSVPKPPDQPSAEQLGKV